MHRAIAGLAAAVVAIGAMGGAASADTLENLIGNSLKLTDASGNHRVLQVGADNRFSQHRSDGVEASGPWNVDDQGRFCFTPRGEATMCLPAFPAGKQIGDSWDMTGPRGNVVWKAELLAGNGQEAAGADKPE